MRRASQDSPEAQPRKTTSELGAKITDCIAGLERLATIVTEVTIQAETASNPFLPKGQLLRIRAVAAEIRDELIPSGSQNRS